MINVKEEIKKNQITIIVIPSEKYLEITLFLSRISAELGKTLYVNINKPYSSLVESLKENKIPIDKFYFIDAITKTVRPEKNGCVEFVSGPTALTEMSLAIFGSIEREDFYCMLFDSLSTLLIYEDSLTVTKFVHNLISRFRSVKTKAVFTVLRAESSSELIKDLSMFADKIIDVTWTV